MMGSVELGPIGPVCGFDGYESRRLFEVLRELERREVRETARAIARAATQAPPRKKMKSAFICNCANEGP